MSKSTKSLSFNTSMRTAEVLVSDSKNQESKPKITKSKSKSKRTAAKKSRKANRK